MSKTSLGQKNQLRQKEDFSSLKQLQSVRRGNQEQYHVNIYDQIDTFLHMKDRYLKVQKQNRFMDFDSNSYGQCYSNVKDGYGINVFKNGDRYIGFWQKNTMHGMGIYIFKSETDERVAYLGEFNYGKFNGIGKMVRMIDDSNGEVIYRGNWSEGKKAEQGVHYYDTQQSFYVGNWLHDQKSGEGRFVSGNMEYQGLWLNNVKNGQGKLKITDNNLIVTYQGYWQNDELDQGEIIYMDQSGVELGKYKGKLFNGKKHGYGIYNYRGMQFQGNFQDDKIKGEGIIKGSSYLIKGFISENTDWSKNAQNLLGSINYDNKDSFDGIVSINNGIIHREKGTYRLASGDIAEGQFIDNREGKLQGSYLYKWRNGQQRHY